MGGEDLGGGLARAGEELVGAVRVGPEEGGVEDVRVGFRIPGAVEVEAVTRSQAGGVGVAY